MVVFCKIMTRAKLLSVASVLRLLLRRWHLAGKFWRLYLIHKVFLAYFSLHYCDVEFVSLFCFSGFGEAYPILYPLL